VPFLDGPDTLDRAGERRPDGSAPPRVLWVEGATPLLFATPLSELRVEMVREAGARQALERLEADGDFAVIICDEDVGGSTGLELLGAVRSLSPTTARLLVSDRLDSVPPGVDQPVVFRCISPHSSLGELRTVMREALDYHQLLATCPAQPVEGSRFERAAILPPAKPEPRRPQVPAWKGFREASQNDSGPLVVDAAPAVPGELLVLRPNRVRVGLRVVGRIVELLPGLTVVGRSRTCHIPIPDAQVSRRHATFSNDGDELRVRNVSQTNGVRVNGTPLEREASVALQIGDRVGLGAHEIEVCALGDYCPSFEPTHSVSLQADESDTSELSTLVTLAQVADKYFALGQMREAERILRPVLEGLLRHCEAGRAPAAGDVELATTLSLRIAEATREGEWINYAFELFCVLERPLPADAIERLYRVVPEIHGVKMSSFRAYLEVLGRIPARFGPKERFLLRRIQGLETRLMMSAHL
jgi:pSer/pThr/pTyr-binding forkhead associated (FHA) protein/CheY-like chemotaxis protein